MSGTEFWMSPKCRQKKKNKGGGRGGGLFSWKSPGEKSLGGKRGVPFKGPRGLREAPSGELKM